MRRAAGSMAIVVVLFMVGTACSNDPKEGGATVGPQGAAPPLAGGGAQANPRVEQVTVYDNRVEPAQLNLTAGVPVQLQVTNRSAKDCLFAAGNYLSNLNVPAGKSETMSFTIPNVAQNPPDASATATMGCQGDSQRQGKIVVDFKGIRPGTGQ